jgi:hypothetical protein
MRCESYCELTSELYNTVHVRPCPSAMCAANMAFALACSCWLPIRASEPSSRPRLDNYAREWRELVNQNHWGLQHCKELTN